MKAEKHCILNHAENINTNVYNGINTTPNTLNIPNSKIIIIFVHQEHIITKESFNLLDITHEFKQERNRCNRITVLLRYI